MSTESTDRDLRQTAIEQLLHVLRRKREHAAAAERVRHLLADLRRREKQP